MPLSIPNIEELYDDIGAFYNGLLTGAALIAKWRAQVPDPRLPRFIADRLVELFEAES